MTIYKKITDDDPGRAAMRAIRLARSARAATPPELQGLLPNVVGDEENKLPRSLHNVVNSVVVQEILDIPEVPNRKIVFHLTWGGNDIGDPKELMTPITDPITVSLPASATITEGIYDLGYRYIYQGNEYNYHTPVPIYIDKEAPNRGAPGVPVILPVEIVDGLLTKEYLTANDGVWLTIPTPQDRRTGDVVDVHYGESDPAQKIGSFEVGEDHSIEMRIKLSLAQIVIGKEGPRIIFYQWRDRVGNIGPHSIELPVKVVLTDAPSNLKPPKVPEAVPPALLIDLKDAFPHLGVVIEAYDNSDPEDEIELDYDGIKQSRKKVGSGFDVIFDVPYADVSKGGLGPRTDVPLAYSVWRSGLEYPELIGALINLDLTRPGPDPEDPENPEIGNPKLSEVTVQGAVTPTPNKLELVDTVANAIASFTIAKPHEEDDLYTLFMNGIPVPGATYESDGTEADDYLIELNITPEFFKSQGNNPAAEFHYEITNPAWPNSNYSLRQEVSIYVIPVILPVPKVNYTESADGFDYIVCSSLRNISNVGWAAVVDVPGGGPLKPNMVLDFVWSGVTYQTGAPVDVPDVEFQKTLSGTEHITGFTVYLPLQTALNPIRDGSGSVLYSSNIDGREEFSDSHDVQVVVQNGEGEDCPLT